MTTEPGRTAARWSILCPEPWWEIPLGDAAHTRAAIKRIVHEQFGYADSDPRAKRRVQADLLSVASSASDAGGRVLVLGRIPVAGIVVTTNLVVYEPDLTFEGRDEVDEFFGEMTSAVSEESAAELSDFDLGPVLRISTVQRDAIMAPEGPGYDPEHATLDNLKVEYWVWCEDENLMLYFVFASPWMPMAESLLILFDVLVSSLVVEAGEP